MDFLTKETYLNSLDDFLGELQLAERSDSTLKKYRRDLMKIVPSLPDTFKKETIIAYKNALIDLGYKLSSINSFLVILNKYLKWLNAEQLQVRLLKTQRRGSREDIITLEDYKRLLRIAKRRGEMDMYYLMKVLAWTGIRIDELKFITAESLSSNYIQVTNKGKTRTVILRQDLARDLRRYCRQKGIRKGVIFVGRKEGVLMAKSTIWRRMKKIAGVARVNKAKVHPHSFRHFFAKEFLKQNNNNILELADILGHDSLDTTRIYNVSTDAEKRKKIENMKF